MASLFLLEKVYLSLGFAIWGFSPLHRCIHPVLAMRLLD
jgi:hypothetical protein